MLRISYSYFYVANLTQAPVISWSTLMAAPNTVWSRMVPEPFATYPGITAHESTNLQNFKSRIENTIDQLLFLAVNWISERIILNSMLDQGYEFGSFLQFERNSVL